MIGPFRLAPYFSPRPWGSLDLRPWYSQTPSEPIGEAWLTGKDCLVESGEEAGSTLAEVVAKFPDPILGPNGRHNGNSDFPLLLKLLFPKEKLSVQVHPDDAMAQTIGEPRGKTECWYVLSAEPGASIALGLREGTSPGMIRNAVADQSLEHLLNWIPVSAGEMIYVDAGTVHAIGPGVVLLETQQYSDVTYRLYDYGRPRELHLEPALKALRVKTEAGKVAAMHHPGCDVLIRQKYFIVEKHSLARDEVQEIDNTTGTVQSLVAVSGSARVHVPGESTVELVPGRAVVVPGSYNNYKIEAGEGAEIIRAIPPGGN